jgi:4-amino-4-deoxy-L-arabinose transferase-like glycosyltransferase
VLLVYLVARQLFDHRVAIAAAVVFAIWPNVVFYTGVPALETAFIFFWSLAVWLVLRTGWPAAPLGVAPAIAAGVTLGVSMLIRPFSMVLIPAMLVALLVARHPWRRAARDALLVGVIALGVVVPWTVRNAIQLDGFVPVSTNMGETFCLGHHPGASGGFVDVPEYCTHPYEILREPADDIARNRVGFEQGLRYAIRHPATEARLLAKKAWYIGRDDHDALDAVESNGADPFIDPAIRDVLRWTADITYYLIVLAAAAGLGRFVRDRDARRWVVLLIAAGLLAFPLGLYGLARFKVPLAPFLAIAAGVGVMRLGAWRVRDRQDWRQSSRRHRAAHGA